MIRSSVVDRQSSSPIGSFQPRESRIEVRPGAPEDLHLRIRLARGVLGPKGSRFHVADKPLPAQAVRYCWTVPGDAVIFCPM